MTRNLIRVDRDTLIAAINTGKLSPDHRVERDARDRTPRQVRFQAADAAAKRVLFDEVERGESPVAICLDFVKLVVSRDLDEAWLDETGASHLCEQCWHRRIALQLDADRFRKVAGERPPAPDSVVGIGNGYELASWTNTLAASWKYAARSRMW